MFIVFNPVDMSHLFSNMNLYHSMLVCLPKTLVWPTEDGCFIRKTLREMWSFSSTQNGVAQPSSCYFYTHRSRTSKAICLVGFLMFYTVCRNKVKIKLLVMNKIFHFLSS